MKNLTRTLLLAISVFFISCGDDDGDVFSIVGVYTLTQESVTGCNDPAEDVTENLTCTSTDCETLILGADGTFSEVKVENGVSTTSKSGTYAIDGSQIIFSFEVNSMTVTDTATFQLDGSRLTLTYPAGTDGCVETAIYSKN